MTGQTLRSIPRDLPDERAHRRTIADAVNVLFRRVVTGDVTLTTTSSTTIEDAAIGPASAVLWVPMSSTAATSTVGLYVTTTGVGTATLGHTTSAGADRAFRYVIVN